MSLLFRYDFQKWSIISLVSVAISLTIGLPLMQYTHGKNTSNSMVDNQTETGQLQKKVEEQLKNTIETSMYNATGIPFDLNKNYSQEETALIVEIYC